MKLDFDKLEELPENCKIVEQVEKDKDSNIYDEEVSQIIRKNLQFFAFVFKL